MIRQHTISSLKDYHIIIPKEELGGMKDKKIHLHLAKPYHDRCDSKGSCKRMGNNEDTLDKSKTKVCYLLVTTGYLSILVYSLHGFETMLHN